MTQNYYGTKRIAAESMNRGEYNKFRGWQLPADEDGADEGYLVEYLDGGKPNIESHAGYVSWSPKEQFDKAYQPFDALNFGHAVEAAKAGHKIARAGWNGKGMWVILYPGCTPVNFDGEEDAGIDFPAIGHKFKAIRSYMAMRTVDNECVPWVASQTDILANDWRVLTD